jgi:uncharacterized protein YbjT (DUF2867 family)
MILVTGASGNVGSAVVSVLSERGAAFRVAARNPRPDEGGVSRSAEAVRLDFRDPSTFREACRGCDAVFLLRPPAVANTAQTLVPFLDVARAEGVRQVVFLSVAGAGDNRMVPHHAVEQHLKRGPASWTILRPGFFAQNLGDAYRRDIVEDDRLFVPAGDGLVTFVDVRDVAEVAVNALLDPASHHGRTYTLTGPEPVAFRQAADMLTAALGRPIRYEPARILAYAGHLKRRRGLPMVQVAVLTLLHVGLRFGQAEAIDPTLARLLGHHPRTLVQYIQDHRSLWALS